ncbi:hypothetical protein HMPREF9081_1108 [Centipeda periodontii DSM 2778]|uniref:Uncharacterized protein n=1 Tax=Centipeda periodontii DSM 2778 TaxID=888060 RepID=F5RLH2_9FIRM|nr:hypothetical protein HMPREF9081_1108 [Centipeda periodontii DSM 2778]
MYILYGNIFPFNEDNEEKNKLLQNFSRIFEGVYFMRYFVMKSFSSD